MSPSNRSRAALDILMSRMRTDKLKSSFSIGDIQLGTQYWQSENETEFTNKHGLDSGKASMLKPKLSTPRSLKKGYVTMMNYEALHGLKTRSDNEAAMAKHQLEELYQLQESWGDDERQLMTSMESQLDLQSRVARQLRDALATLAQLEDQASLSKNLMRDMKLSHGLANLQGVPADTAHAGIIQRSAESSEAQRQRPNFKTSPAEEEREMKLLELEEQICFLGEKIQALSKSHSNMSQRSRPASAALSKSAIPRIRSPYNDRAETYKRRNDLNACHWKP